MGYASYPTVVSFFYQYGRLFVFYSQVVCYRTPLDYELPELRRQNTAHYLLTVYTNICEFGAVSYKISSPVNVIKILCV